MSATKWRTEAKFKPLDPPIPFNYRRGSIYASGNKDMISTNHFVIQGYPDTLEKYSVAFKMSQPLMKEAEEKSLSKKTDALSLIPNNGTIREPRQSEKRTIMLALLRNDLQGLNSWADRPWVTDYTTTVWSKSQFPWDQGDLTFNDVTFKKENGRTGSASVTFSWKEQMKFDKKKPADLSQDHITAINALASYRVSAISQQTLRVRANKFYVASGYESLDGLAAYRGYFTSARASNDSLLLNVNTVTSPFLEPMLISTLMKTLNDHNGEYNLQSVLKGVRVRVIYDRQEHDPTRNPNTEELRTKVIKEIGSKPGKQSISVTSNQTVTAYFIGLGYNITESNLECIDVGIRDQHIWIPPELLEIVDCEQQFRAPLSSLHTAGMIRKALRGPAANAQLIVEEALGDNLMGLKPRDVTVMNPLEITISEHMLQLPFSKSETPRIEYGGNANNNFQVKPRAAAWNLRNCHFFDPAGSNKADGIKIGLCVLGRMSRNSRTKISRGMERAFEAVGMDVRFDDSIAGDCGFSQGKFYEDSLHEELNKWYGIGQTPERKPKFLGPLLIVLNKHNKAVYAAIKRWADCHIGVQTVCAVYDNIVNKGVPQYFANLTLKFNPKLGGTNHRILVPEKQGDPFKSGPPRSDPPKSGSSKSGSSKSGSSKSGPRKSDPRKSDPRKSDPCKSGSSTSDPSTSDSRKSDPREFAFHAIEDTTIVMGADVVHPPMGGMPGCPSIAALVASEDSTFFNFPGSMRLNPAREEIVADLEDMVLERLRRYCDLNKGKLPWNILFYRDGVSEGQYYAVKTNEVPKIRAAWDKARNYVRRTYSGIETEDRAKIHFIVVQKRHHVRFYAADETYCATSGDSGNVEPGLLVKSLITRPQDANFYLQSHAAIKGTARSAHYVVLHDEIPELKIRSANDNDVPKVLTDITHAFCYNYARATRGVSYCGPTYYADRLCDRGYHYMRKFFSGTPPIPSPKQKDSETDRDFHVRVKTIIENHSHWNFGNLRSNPPRRNPWHPNIDNTMFYL